MGTSYKRNLEDLIEALKRAKSENMRINLLIGAGASVSGNIPLANTIIKDIEKKFPREYSMVEKKTYAECMAALTSIERRNLISTYVDRAKVNWAHLLIAHLMKNRIINTVLTTNFDNLLIRACALENSIPGVYDLAAARSFRPELLYENAIIHLHGQHTGFVLCNTENELDKQINNIKPTFIELNKNSMWIVVGYSGENDPIVKLFHEHKNSDNRLYWVGYEDQEPADDVRKLLDDREKYCYYIRGYDADSFFVNLCKGLGKYPPDIIRVPFTHLYNTVDTITEYVDKGIPFINKESYTSITKDMVRKAIEDYEQNNVVMAEYYFRLKLIEKYKNIMEEAPEEERGKIEAIADKKNSRQEIISGTIEYIDDMEKNLVEFNIPNLNLALVVILTFTNEENKLKYISKVQTILDNKYSSNRDNVSYIILRMDVQKSLYIIDRKVERLNKMLMELSDSNMNDISRKEYILIKFDILKKLGEYYSKEKNMLALGYFDDAIKFINDNESSLGNTLYNYLKGNIYIKKIFFSKENFINLGVALNCFSNVIKYFLNRKIEVKDNESSEERVHVDFIVEWLYRLTIVYNDLAFQKPIIEWIKNEFEKIESSYVIKSYLEAVNNIIYYIEDFNEKSVLIKSIVNIINSFNIDNFNDKEKHDVSGLLNHLAYVLIENNEREYSKLILNLSLGALRTPFNVATLGFYELRIEGNLDLGIKLYDDAAGMECDANLRKALEQKKNLEVANYNLNIGNKLEAEIAIDNAIKIGEVSESWKPLFEEAIKIKEEFSVE